MIHFLKDYLLKSDLDLDKIQKWRFQTDKIEIDNEKWFSKDTSFD